MTLDEQFEIINGAKNGENIQVFKDFSAGGGDARWVDILITKDYTYDFIHEEYRIKPKEPEQPEQSEIIKSAIWWHDRITQDTSLGYSVAYPTDDGYADSTFRVGSFFKDYRLIGFEYENKRDYMTPLSSTSPIMSVFGENGYEHKKAKYAIWIREE